MDAARQPRRAKSLAGKSWLISVGILVALSLALWGIEELYRSRLDVSWHERLVTEEAATSAKVRGAFSAYQKESLDLLERLALRKEVADVLTLTSDSSLNQVFSLLVSASRPDYALELYNRKDYIVAWAGNRGPQLDRSRIPERKTSLVLQGPIYSYLLLSVPVVREADTLGMLIGKRLFDVNYPINNRFINAAAFSSTFTAQLGVTPEFDFSPGAERLTKPGLYPVPLEGIDGATLGVASLKAPSLEARIADLRDRFSGWRSAVLFVLVAVALWPVARFVATSSSPLLRSLLVIACLWILRYMLILLNLPLSIVHTPVFGPDYFASPLWFGVARSLGDMLVSSAVLMVSVLILAREGMKRSLPFVQAESRLGLPGKVFSAAGAIVLVILLFLFIRGFAAAIRSAVFDSALSYNDPTSVIPSFELSIMLAALLLLALSLVISAVLILGWVYRLVRSVIPPRLSDRALWLFMFAGVVLSGVVYGMMDRNPLMSQADRAVALAVLMLLTGMLLGRMRRGRSVLALTTGVAIAGTALLFIIPQLDAAAHASDRVYVELLARDMTRPEDTWLSLLTNQALDELTGKGIATVLSSADSAEIEKLAFTGWAGSILSREGNNCSVTFVDRQGQIVSDFNLGITGYPALGHAAPLPPARSVQTETKSENGFILKWSTGYAPVVGDSDHRVGGVWVELSGIRGTRFNGESPEILRNYSRDRLEKHYRSLIFCEYFQGRLVYSTPEDLPLDRSLPAGVNPETCGRAGCWVQADIGETRYETFYLRDPSSGDENSWIAIGMAALDFRWHMYSFLRYILFFLLLGLCVGLVMAASRNLRGWRYVPDFRSKLLAAFIAASLIPVLLLAINNRQYIIDQANLSTARALGNQTSMVVSEIQRQLGLNAPVVLARLTDERCMQIADDLNTDFNVYFDATIQASSKPEMFAAELLDARVSAPAYQSLVIEKKPFFSERQAIGNLPYVVGYRPLVAENGMIIGIVSVPTLYRQADIDERLTRRNVFLYGTYAFAALISLLASTLFANQISAPIRRLKMAARRIAVGSLDVDLRNDRKDELGDLERAFAQMTSDLRRTQEEMIRTNRELAWKEMAKQVAHEIKNPLTPIKLSIQHLRRAYEDGVKEFDQILSQVSDTVLAQIETLSRIASEFSRFARMPARFVEPLDAREVIREAQNLFRQHEGLHFELDLGEQPCVINADREELRRALINIIRNSVQAMEERGTLSIRAAMKGRDVEILIRDTGPGIPEAVRRRLFEPNFSTKTDGMGLGLAIVKKIINDLGGTVSVESTMGKGTTVAICIPVIVTPAEQTEDRNPG